MSAIFNCHKVGRGWEFPRAPWGKSKGKQIFLGAAIIRAETPLVLVRGKLSMRKALFCTVLGASLIPIVVSARAGESITSTPSPGELLETTATVIELTGSTVETARDVGVLKENNSDSLINPKTYEDASKNLQKVARVANTGLFKRLWAAFKAGTLELDAIDIIKDELTPKPNARFGNALAHAVFGSSAYYKVRDGKEYIMEPRKGENPVEYPINTSSGVTGYLNLFLEKTGILGGGTDALEKIAGTGQAINEIGDGQTENGLRTLGNTYAKPVVKCYDGDCKGAYVDLVTAYCGSLCGAAAQTGVNIGNCFNGAISGAETPSDISGGALQSAPSNPPRPTANSPAPRNADFMSAPDNSWHYIIAYPGAPNQTTSGTGTTYGSWRYVSGISDKNGDSGYWQRTVIDTTGIRTETSLTKPNPSPATPSSAGTGAGISPSNSGKITAPASGNIGIQIDPALTRTGGASSQKLTGNVFKNTVVPGTTAPITPTSTTVSTTPSTAAGQQLEISRLNDDPLIDPATGEVYKQWQSSGQLNPAVNFIIPPELLEHKTSAPARDISGASSVPTSLPFVPNLAGQSHANVKVKPALLGEGKTNLKPPTALAARSAPRPTMAQPAMAIAPPVNAAPTTEPDPPPVEPAPEGINTDQAIDLLNGLAGAIGAASSMVPSTTYSPPQAIGRPQASAPALQRIPRQSSQSTITGQ